MQVLGHNRQSIIHKLPSHFPAVYAQKVLSPRLLCHTTAHLCMSQSPAISRSMRASKISILLAQLSGGCFSFCFSPCFVKTNNPSLEFLPWSLLKASLCSSFKIPHLPLHQGFLRSFSAYTDCSFSRQFDLYQCLWCSQLIVIKKTKQNKTKTCFWGIPWWCRSQDSVLQLQEAWV